MTDAAAPFVLPMALTAVSEDAARSLLHATAPPLPPRDLEEFPRAAAAADGAMGLTWTGAGVSEMNLGTEPPPTLAGTLTSAPLDTPPPLTPPQLPTRTTPLVATEPPFDSGDDGGVNLPPAAAAVGEG